MHIMFLQNEANQEGGYKACTPSLPDIYMLLLQICLPHQLVTPFLSGSPSSKKIPGSALRINRQRYEEIKEGKIDCTSKVFGDFWSFSTRKNGCLYKKLRFYKCNCIQLEYQSILIPDVIASHPVSHAVRLFFQKKYCQHVLKKFTTRWIKAWLFSLNCYC